MNRDYEVSTWVSQWLKAQRGCERYLAAGEGSERDFEKQWLYVKLDPPPAREGARRLRGLCGPNRKK